MYIYIYHFWGFKSSALFLCSKMDVFRVTVFSEQPGEQNDLPLQIINCLCKQMKDHRVGKGAKRLRVGGFQRQPTQIEKYVPQHWRNLPQG